MRRVIACSLAALWSIVAGCSSASDESGGTGASGSSGSGATGATGGSGAAGGGGAECDDDGDCPVPGSCTTIACKSGACSTTALPQGTPVFEDVASGDCKRKVCNGSGEVEEVTDAADLPNDHDPCTLDACGSDGSPSHSTVPDGTDCAGPNGDKELVCVNGACTGCKNDTDCPGGGVCHEPVCDDPRGGGSDGTCGLEIAAGKVVGDADPEDCIQAVCDSTGAIGINALADGTFCEGGSFCNPSTCSSGTCEKGQPPALGASEPNQTQGDCQVVVCDGSGGSMSQDDDSDVPGDGNGDDCVVPGCDNGGVVNLPAPLGQSCVGGLGACDGNGNCV